MKQLAKYLLILAVFALVITGDCFIAGSKNEIPSWKDFYTEVVLPFGYPNDVGGAYYDNETNKICYLVVDPTPKRIEELRTKYGGNVGFTPCKYTYTELMRVQYEIYIQMLTDQNIISVGTGWISDSSGNVTGFGESGKENRVVVDVDKSEYARYSAEFEKKYSDKVFAEAVTGRPQLVSQRFTDPITD